MKASAGAAAHSTSGALDAQRRAALAAERPRVLNGRYELGTPLGQGGMGVVYRATDRQHPDRALAIKFIRADSVSESSLGLFKAEFKAMV